MNLPNPEITKSFQNLRSALEIVENSVLKGTDGLTVEELDIYSNYLSALRKELASFPLALKEVRGCLHESRMVAQSTEG